MEFYVDVRFKVKASSIHRAPGILEPVEELVLNDGDNIKEMDFLQVKVARDDFYD